MAFDGLEFASRRVPVIERKIRMAKILEDPSEAALVRAIEENLFEGFATIASYMPQASWREGREALTFRSGIPFPLFNGVFRAQLGGADTKAKIDEIMAEFKEGGVPMIWWTGPATGPAGLGEELEGAGLQHSAEMPGMAVDLEELTESRSPPGLTIERVTDTQSLKAYCEVLVKGFGMPDIVGATFLDVFSRTGLGRELPWRLYLGRLEGEPVATSACALVSGVAGIYNVSTLGEARRGGIGATMTLAPLMEARAQGYRAAILHSSEMGVSVYRGLGFREYCRVSQYVWVPG